MPLADGGLGIIDFQDALIGPITYDLVSLLRDSYIDWSDEQVADWVESYRMQLLDTGFALPSDSEFLKQFDLMGMQRQLKVVGIFSRLWLRDGKEGYLKDIPRTFGYLLNAAKKYPEFAELRQALEALIPSMKANEDLNRYPLAPWVTQ
jgi:aminoglycoside/choline kinase family phosphotransferase